MDPYNSDNEQSAILYTDTFALFDALSPDVEAISQVLANTTCHEIGHLLVGPGKHSLAGLMSARWSEKEIKQLAKGYLPFAGEKAGVIRSRLDGLRAPDAGERARDGQTTE